MHRSLRRASLVAIWLMWATFCPAGQFQPLTAPGSEAGGNPASDQAVISERQVSPRLLAPNVYHDQKAVWTFPARLARGKDWKPTLAVVAAAGALVALDPHDTPYFRRTAHFIDFNKALSGRNTMLGMAILPAAVYIAGLNRKDTYAKHTALLAGEAAADTAIVALLMKDAVRRVRPSDIPPHGNFYDSWFEARGSLLGKNASFPSGHTIEAFSIATVFAERYRQHRWVPWVSYGLATAVGFSRISLQAHFPSDVFAGAALGYFISHGVVLRSH